MAGIKSFFRHIVWLTKGVQVYGLVGKAGTGKSFRAQLIAKRYGIDMIIDDGLLIRDQKILAGRSAKQEKGAYSAVKTALFDDSAHSHEVREALEGQKFKRLLILGTSERMIFRIAKKLRLPHPAQIINIEDVATPEEIEKAKRSRKRDGQHIIPVPAMEVKRRHAQIFFNAVKIFFKRQFGFIKKHDVFEKTIVRPLFVNKGRVAISEQALTQMVLHCVADFDPGLSVKKVVIIEEAGSYALEVLLRIPFKAQLSGPMHQLQAYIYESIESFTSVALDRVNLTIDSIA